MSDFGLLSLNIFMDIKRFSRWLALRETDTRSGGGSSTYRSSLPMTGSYDSNQTSDYISPGGHGPSSVPLGDHPRANSRNHPQGDPSGLPTIQQIAVALRGLDPDIPDPRGGGQNPIRQPDGSVEQFPMGTRGYIAPEMGVPHREQNRANYERFLLNDIPQLFPDLQQQAAQIRQQWQAMRNYIVSSLEESNNDPNGGSLPEEPYRRPIVYSVALRALRDASEAFHQVSELLAADNSPQLNPIRQMFQPIYQGHQAIVQATEGPLQARLDQSRDDPRSLQ